MAKYLFTVWPFTGCVNPQIAVARVLAKHGHEIAFYTGRGFRTLVEEQGFRYYDFNNLDERHMEQLLLSSDSMGRNWERPWRLRPQIRTFFLDTVPQQYEDLKAIISDWGPGAVITDPAMWAPFLLVSEIHSLPVAILSYACGCMLPGPGAPPMGLGLPVARTWWTKWSNWTIGTVMDMFLSDTRRAASALRAKHGLPALQGPVIGLAGKLPLYLVPSCPEFDYNRRDLPAGVQYVGPLQWYPPPPAVNWLDTIPSGRPWVHVTEGTLHVREPFLIRAAALGLSNLPVEVIITTGDDRRPEDLELGTLPPNVHLAKWVNHADLLPRTSVMVTTAGGGTVMAGMGAGVPLVVVPTEWDKAENAQRVVEIGAGIRISPSRCTPERVSDAVQTILREPAYTENVKKIAVCLQRQGGPERAASLLESIAIDTHRTTSTGDSMKAPRHQAAAYS